MKFLKEGNCFIVACEVNDTASRLKVLKIDGEHVHGFMYDRAQRKHVKTVHTKKELKQLVKNARISGRSQAGNGLQTGSNAGTKTH